MDLAFYDQIKDLCYIRRQRPEVVTRKEVIDGGECTVVFDDVEKGFYKLKGNASTIWEMLDGRTSVETIVGRIAETAPEQREEVVRDVCAFVYKIGKKGLIKAAVKKSGVME